MRYFICLPTICEKITMARVKSEHWLGQKCVLKFGLLELNATVSFLNYNAFGRFSISQSIYVYILFS